MLATSPAVLGAQTESIPLLTAENKQVFLFRAESDVEMELWMRQLIVAAVAQATACGPRSQTVAAHGTRSSASASSPDDGKVGSDANSSNDQTASDSGSSHLEVAPPSR